tara:strand:+ start:285 stop:2015 length:1731 start_codon:yes stop_codon:yes gene_type:complete
LNRRLAAIIAADVVDYSRLMGEDQTRTLDVLREFRRKLFEPAVVTHRGNVIKRMGDGWIVEFASVSDAVNCSLDIQDGLKDHDIIRLRIGIHIGEVVFEEEDVFGDGVNIAARLETLAEPGAVLISDTAYNSLDGKAARQFNGGTPHKLKNIFRPVQVWRWPSESSSGMTPSGISPTQTPQEPPSIAVLPFVNKSSDPEQDYFADGVTEDIITALSRLRGFFVISQNTMITYKGKDLDPRTIGQELGVRYILRGNIRATGNRVRITAELSDPATGAQLWAERFDRPLDDVFAVQDEITESVVGRIEPELYAAELAKLKQTPPQNLGSWEFFIRGLHLYSQHTDQGTREALEMLDRAIALDGAYAKALGLKALTLVWRLIQGWEDPAIAMEKATESVNLAIQADAQEPWAHMAQGVISICLRQSDNAIAALQQAINASPNFAYAQGMFGASLALAGRAEDALPCIDRAMRLSPRDIFSEEYHLYYAFAYFVLGKYKEAAASAERAILLRPGHPSIYVIATASYQLDGATDKAGMRAQKLIELVPDTSLTEIEASYPFTRVEDMTKLINALRAAGLPE